MTGERLRTEGLLAVATMLAGALAGIVVQAAIEVGRGRRDDRAQLRAAAAQLDALDAELQDTRAALTAERADAERLRELVAELRDEASPVDDELDGTRPADQGPGDA